MDDVLVLEWDDALLSACAGNMLAAYRVTYGEVWPLERACARLSQLAAGASGFALVAVQDGHACGHVLGRPYEWLDGRRLFVEELVVAPEKQGSGIGRHLLCSLLALALDRGIVGLSLHSYIDSRAWQWYVREGCVVSKWQHLERSMSRAK